MDRYGTHTDYVREATAYPRPRRRGMGCRERAAGLCAEVHSDALHFTNATKTHTPSGPSQRHLAAFGAGPKPEDPGCYVRPAFMLLQTRGSYRKES